MDRKILEKRIAETLPNLMKTIDLQSWETVQIPSKGIKSPGNGKKKKERKRKEGREGGRRKENHTWSLFTGADILGRKAEMNTSSQGGGFYQTGSLGC